MGINNKFLLCLIAVLLPIIAVGYFASNLVDRQIAERTTATLANTQRLEVARIEQILDGYAKSARSLASGTHARELFSQLHDAFRAEPPQALSHAHAHVIGGIDDFPTIDPTASWPLQQLALAMQRRAGIIGSSVVELQLVSRDHAILGETMGFSWIPADGKLIDRSMRKVKTDFGDAFVNDNGEQRLGMVSPVIANTGEVVGALVMETRLGPITDMISQHERIAESFEAHIAQPTRLGDAQFITPLRFDRTAAFNKIVPAEHNLAVNQALHSPKSQVIKALDYRGIESFLAFQTIADTGWGLVVKVDTAESFAPTENLRSWLSRAIFASTACTALIYLCFLVPVAKRLDKAAMAARQIMNGNLSARLNDNKNDEITELACSINSLARDLGADQKMRSEVEARLRHQALHDELTGLLNRKHANKVIKQLSDDPHQENSVMFLDLNGFKDVNDFYGHATGDEVLKRIAQRLAEKVPQGATLARWGGDEFVVILPGADDQQATEFALTLHNAFDEPVNSGESRHRISCSIGLATSSKAKSLHDALIEADALMYEQKKRQRFNRTKGGMATRSVERALLENRMEMWLQPMVRLERPGNYALVGAETQLRMRSSHGGYVLPEQFMPEIMDSSSVRRELDYCALGLAINALKRWTFAGIVDWRFRLCLQLSSHTLNDASFPPLLENMLSIHKVAAEQLQIELPIESYPVNEAVLTELRRLGVSLALNGVNAEPNLLRHVPATRPSVAIIGKPCLEDTVVLPHLMSTCNELQVQVLARCVESRQQLAELHALGVTQFQGRLFEEPVTAVDFVSRWGQTRLTGLGKAMTLTSALRLAS